MWKNRYFYFAKEKWRDSLKVTHKTHSLYFNHTVYIFNSHLSDSKACPAGDTQPQNPYLPLSSQQPIHYAFYGKQLWSVLSTFNSQMKRCQQKKWLLSGRFSINLMIQFNKCTSADHPVLAMVIQRQIRHHSVFKEFIATEEGNDDGSK